MKLYKRKEEDTAPVGQADPYMIQADDGRYYLYATGPDGASLFSSDSLPFITTCGSMEKGDTSFFTI